MTPSNYAPSDDVTAQLRDIERQGGGMARLAHVSAGALLAAFSLGSLISISGAAFTHFLSEWNAGRVDVPDGINVIVNLLMVLAADVALLYAASVLRVLVTAQAPASEQKVHQWAMIGASVLESATYAYMLWVYDKPATAFLWIIGISRALASPLLAAYLSMARPLPVSPRDVAYQSALAAGKGVVRDVTVLSGDPSAPLERKVRIYRASALMSPHDRTRFDGIIEAVRQDDTLPAPVAAAIVAPLEMPQTGAPDDRPPTGGGTPTVAPRAVSAAAVRTDGSTGSKVVKLPTEEAQRQRRQTAAQARGGRANGRGVRTAAERQQEAAEKRQERLQLVAAWLAEDPGVATRELVRRLQAVEHSRVSESTVTSLRREVEAGSNPITAASSSSRHFAQ